jgi:signal transduction histidine kinase/ligand-binding sensor domain-containing protein
LLLALVCATTPAAVTAETAGSGLDDYSVTTWSEKDGLPPASIRALEQGADGDLWLGTETGLVRFDGQRFIPFERVQHGYPPSGSVSALLRATDGSLWVGLNLFDPQRWTRNSYVRGRPSVARVRDGVITTFGEAEGIPDGQVTNFYQDSAGAIWAGSAAGLFRFDGRQWHRVPLPDSGRAAVNAVREDAAGGMWAVGPLAVFRRPSRDAAFEIVTRLSVASNVWQGLSLDRDGRMWMADFESGVRLLNDTGVASRAPAYETKPGSPWRSWKAWGVQILHDSKGTMWVATRGQGLWRIPALGTTDKPRIITSRDGLVNDAVQAIIEDRDGNIWIGTPAGLQRLSPHRVTPVRDLGVVRTLEATADGSVWVGTSAGLTRVTASGRRLLTAEDGLPGRVVLTLHADRVGGLWIATERGVSRYAGGRFTPIKPHPTMQRVFSVTTTRPGDVWMRDLYFQLYHWRDGAFVPLDDVPEDHRRNVFAIYGDRAGNLWIGNAGGRLGVRRADGTFHTYELPIGAVTRLKEDRQGVMWAGGDEGVSRIGAQGIESITRAQGFPGSAKAIVEDRAGDLWVGIGSGITRIDKAEFSRAAAAGGRGFHYRFVNAADGVAGTPIAESGNPGVLAADGTLWFSTSGGVTLVDPARVGASPRLPPVRIESVAADGQRFDAETRMFEPSRASHVHVLFSALTLTDPTRVRFRYRLEDYDHEWVDAPLSREASYINLPPGQYRFVVETTNGDGIWKTGAVTTFGIAPMFYQTGWFYALCVVAAAGLVTGAWRLRVAQVRQQFALVLGERIRMSRDIHDTLLQALAGLALEIDDLSHNLDGARPGTRERTLSMRRRVEAYLREARLLIWDLRTPELATRDLPQALRDIGERAIGDRPVQFDVVVNGTPQRWPPRVKEQLLLIGQEAISNAVRHGHPTRVDLELHCDNKRASLRVTDDGRGFVLDDALHADGHFGLRGMKERAAQVRGTIVIQSTPGRGTLVEATVPTI